MGQRYMMRCNDCQNALPIDALGLTCPVCAGQGSIVYDFKAIRTILTKREVERRGPGVWKYGELLPVTTLSNVVSLGEGGTFLQKCDGLATTLGVKELYVKNETTNPTGSFIDRGMTVLVSTAVAAPITSLRCVPIGNLGASLAAYATKSGLPCRIQLSSEVDLGKLYQMIAYNADIQLGDDRHEHPRNKESDVLVTPSNPFLLEGEKTIAYEICEQLRWHPPSRIIAPMGTGGLTSMIWRGLQELVQIGFIDHAASMITGVQAEGCCPIVEAYRNRSPEITPIHEPMTLAVDIKVGNPSLGKQALMAIRESKGTAIAVSDSEIVEAIRLLAKTEGIFAEPSAASTIAGLKKLMTLGTIGRDERIVCVITGSGLKDPSIMEKLVDDRRRVKMFVYGAEGRRLTKLGETKLHILQILSKRDLHGYGIWQVLDAEHAIKITVPSVYQHLAELEALHLVRKGEARAVIGERKRRYYTLTRKGKDALQLKL
jgi:threonine synthase